MPKGKKTGATKGGAAAEHKIGCCKMAEDNYPLLQCKKCTKWSHVDCLGLPLNTNADMVHAFTCQACVPGKKTFNVAYKTAAAKPKKTAQAEKTPHTDVEKTPPPEVVKTPSPEAEKTVKPKADAAFEDPKSEEAGGSSKKEGVNDKNAIGWPEETPRSSRPGSFGRKKRSGAAASAGDEAELPEKKSRPTRLNKVTLVSHITDSTKPPAKTASKGIQPEDSEDDELQPESDNNDKNKQEAEMLKEGDEKPEKEGSVEVTPMAQNTDLVSEPVVPSDQKPEKEGSVEVTPVAQNTDLVAEPVVPSDLPSNSGSNASEDLVESARKTYEQLVDANEELLSAVGHPSTSADP